MSKAYDSVGVDKTMPTIIKVGKQFVDLFNDEKYLIIDIFALWNIIYYLINEFFCKFLSFCIYTEYVIAHVLKTNSPNKEDWWSNILYIKTNRIFNEKKNKNEQIEIFV